MGFGLPDDNLHAPNEKFHLANFHRGIESIVRFLAGVGEEPNRFREGPRVKDPGAKSP